MKRILFILLALSLASPVHAGKGYTSDTAPSSCVDGDFWVDTNGTASERLYICEEGEWVKHLGNGTTSNPAYNSVHATSGNLAAANAQVTKKWITDIQYVSGVTSVIHGGAHYICTSNHTSSAATEPGTGGDWEDVWTPTGGSIAWSAGKAYYIDDFVTYSGVIYKCVTNHTSAVENAPGVSTEWESWQSGSEGSTNISVVAGASSVAINSSSGTDGTLNGASTIAAGAMTSTDKSKLDGIATGATANSSDATLLARANHTGTQAASTISDFAATVNSVLATPLSKLSGIATGAEVNVNADWNASSGDAQILNKPTVFTVDSDQTITGEKTFQDIILPLFDTIKFNVQNPEPGCAAGEYKIYFFGTKARQCINGTASDIGSGGATSVAIADITDWPAAVSATEVGYLDGVTGGIQSQINAISANSLPSRTDDPADPSTGYAWVNTTDNYMRVATATGIIAWQGTYTADDHTPTAFSFVDQTDVAIDATNPIVSAAVDIDGLGSRSTTVSVSGDTGCGWQKSVDTGNSTWSSCTSSSGTVNNDPDTQIKACVNRSSSNNTTTNCAVTVGTVSDTFSVTTVASGITYLNEEGFEGTGAPTGWGTNGTGTIDWDYATTPLAGSQSLHITGPVSGGMIAQLSRSQLNTYGFDSGKSNLFCQFRYKPTTWPTSNSSLFTINGSGGVVQINNAGRLYADLSVGGTAETVDSLFSLDTEIYLRVKITLDGTLYVWSSTNGTDWTERISITDGTSGQTWNTNNLILPQMANSGVAVFDEVKVWQE